MVCNCVAYECLNIAFDACSNTIELPLIANETGTWTVLVEFNGTWIRLSVDVTNNERIVIPNVLNEHYVHSIRLLNIAGELFNDTCFKLVTKPVVNH